MVPDGGDALPRSVAAPSPGARSYAAVSSSSLTAAAAAAPPLPALPVDISSTPAPPLPPKIPSRQSTSTSKYAAMPTADLFAPVSTSSFFGESNASTSPTTSTSSRLSSSPTSSTFPNPRARTYSNASARGNDDPSTSANNHPNSSSAMSRIRSGSTGLSRSRAVSIRTASSSSSASSSNTTFVPGQETSQFRRPHSKSLSGRPLPTLPYMQPQLRTTSNTTASNQYGDDFSDDHFTSAGSGLGWDIPPDSISSSSTSWATNEPTPRTLSPIQDQAMTHEPNSFAPPRTNRNRGFRDTFGFRNISGMGWTVPKILEKPGMYDGALGGIWQCGAWDYRTVNRSEKFPELGSRVKTPGKGMKEGDVMPSSPMSEQAPAMISFASALATAAPIAALPSTDTELPATTDEMQVDPASQDLGSPSSSSELVQALESTAPPPPAPIELTPENSTLIITKEELDLARPHPNMYYVHSNHSWALFTPYDNDKPLRPSHDETEVPLWVQSHLTTEDIVPHLSDPAIQQTASAARFDMLQPETRAMFQKLEEELNDPPAEFLTRIDNARTGQSIAYAEPGFYPCVIPYLLFAQLLKSRGDKPKAGETATEARYQAVQLVWRLLDNVLFKGELRPLPSAGKFFSRILGWDELAQDIFIGILGFTISEGERTLTPPPLDERSEEGRIHRSRLVRCWLELGLWLAVTAKMHDMSKMKNYEMGIEPLDAYTRMSALMGFDNLARVPGSKLDYSRTQVMDKKLAEAYDFLGVTPDLADDVLIAVYEQQIARTTAMGPDFLEAIIRIQQARNSDTLQVFIVSEKSLGRVSLTDLETAYKELTLTLQAGRNLPEEELASVFSRRRDEVTHPERRKVLQEAMKIVAEHRQSDLLKVMFVSANDAEDRPAMTLEKARSLFSATADTDDEMLLMAYDYAIVEAPGQKDTLTQALATIGEATGSAAIRQKLSGESGIVIPKVAADTPVGLTNIANTCYLNSLLQYFFTVRELREAVLQFQPTPTIEDDIALGRVGGRRVTKAEVERSKKFVLHLQTLFNQLIHSSTTSITPATELAYLALVPSKDEAEMQKAEEIAVVTDDKDVTPTAALDPIVTSPVSSIADDMAMKSPSILGKRRNSHLDGNTDLDASINLDQIRLNSSHSHSPTQSPATTGKESPPEDYLVDKEAAALALAKSRSLSMSSEEPALKRGKSVEEVTTTKDAPIDSIPAQYDDADDLIIIDGPVPSGSKPPALPPRPRRKSTKLEDQVSNYMSFGRQNDVTECMDNVLFQLECALNPIVNEAPGSSEEQASVLRRTLYGKMRQRLEFLDPSVAEPVRIKEEPFFSLLVDVAEEGHNVYDGLDAVFDNSLVTIEGHQATRRMRLVEVPPILQIQLQRVQYDRVAQKIFKSNAHMDFGEALCLDRYLEVEAGDEEALERQLWTQSKREEIEVRRARLLELKSSRLGNEHFDKIIAEATHHCIGLGSDLGQDFVSADFTIDSFAERDMVESEIVENEKRIDDLRRTIEEKWATQQKAMYELVSVFIHRGTALSGHYFIYQRDSKNPSRWLKYNDAVITEVQGDDKIYLKSKDDTNAYFLVYCRKDRMDSIESIAREL